VGPAFKAADDRGAIGRPDILARLQVWGRMWPLHWNASLSKGREIIAVRDVIAEIVAHGTTPRTVCRVEWSGRRRTDQVSASTASILAGTSGHGGSVDRCRA